MTEWSDFIDKHPWVTFGAFWILCILAGSIGKIGRRVCECTKDKKP